jgi:hypothetical protein
MVMETQAQESIEVSESDKARLAAEAALAQSRSTYEGLREGTEVASAKEIPGSVKPMQYRIPPSDQGSWVLVWELKIDANGEVYGVPTKAPRHQLGLWLEFKKRDDGGPRFTVAMPSRVAAEPQFPCLHMQCRKRMYTRLDMVEHVQGTHPRDARMYDALLKQIMEKAAEENPRVAEIANTIIGMEDRGLVSVEVNPAPRTDKVDVELGKPTVQNIGVTAPVIEDDDGGCSLCLWHPKEGVPNPDKARRMHLIMKHREELE